MRNSRSQTLHAPVLLVALFALAGCSAAPDAPSSEDGRLGAKGAAFADAIYTYDGWMSIDDEYVPRVCTQENGAAGHEALKAQAIAARTYLLRAMRDDPSLGTTSEPVGNGEFFQAYAKTANAGCAAAAAETRGVVGRYEGELVIANYVAGALVLADGSLGYDGGTEHWVTYNDGRTGADVQPTKLSYTARSDNRGCMGQNRSAWLSDRGYDAASILRYFYGADLGLDGLGGPPSDPGAGPADPAPAADACGGVGYAGYCDGATLVWCEAGALRSFNCGDKAMACGWQSDAIGNNCIAAPAEGCGGLTYAGECQGSTLVWCEGAEKKTYDCASAGLSCGYQDDAVGNNCL